MTLSTDILKLNKLSFIRELLLFCILIYFSQGALLTQGTILTQISLLIILMISLYYCFKVLFLQKVKSYFIWAWSLLLLVNFLGYLFTFDLNNPIYVSQLKAILLFFLSFFPFYYLAKKERFNETHLLRFFIVIIFLTILNFNHSKDVILASRISDRTDVVNNIAYNFALLIPYIFLFKKRLISILSIILIFIFIIQGAKRGALIVGIIGALYFIYHQLTTIGGRNKILSYILVLFGIAISFFGLYGYFLSNEYFISRLMEIDEGGSGRNIIFLSLWDAWYNSDSIFSYIFGYGFASTLRLSSTGNFAHNDWLELLINFGLVGIFLYFTIFYGLIREVFRSSYKTYRLILATIISMWFVTTLFSMVYTSTSSVIMTLVLGFIVGKISLNRKLESL